jgi:hypothetical protein
MQITSQTLQKIRRANSRRAGLVSRMAAAATSEPRNKEMRVRT